MALAMSTRSHGHPIMNRQDKQAGQTVTSPIRKRSVVVSGHKTRVSLEEPFWQALHDIAAACGLSMTALINL